jgi:hypothetical protein
MADQHAESVANAEAAGFSDYCTCGHYADWHHLHTTGCFASQFRCIATDCSCEDFVPATPTRTDGGES